MEILRLALLNEGVGAKTSSGYGRMMYVGEQRSQPGFEKAAFMNKNEAAKRIIPAAPMSAETYEVQKVRLLNEAHQQDGSEAQLLTENLKGD